VNEAVRTREVGCIVYIYIYYLLTLRALFFVLPFASLGQSPRLVKALARVESLEVFERRDSEMSSNGVLSARPVVLVVLVVFGCIWLYLVVQN